jgi:hypothetical protein
MSVLETLTCVPIASLAVLTCLVAVARGRIRPRIAWTVAVVGVLSAVGMALARRDVPFDYRIFRLCGLDVLAGTDPHAVAPSVDEQVALNPPTAWPLFELFAALPQRKGAKLWTYFNALLAVLLAPIAHRALRAQGMRSALPRHVLALLAALVALSRASDSNLALGQLATLTAFSILAALWAQGADRPIVSGLFLTVATIKVATLLPFLLLFLRRRDLRTWVTFGVASLALCLATTKPSELPSRLANNLRNIEISASEGLVNDYSYAGPSHSSLIGLDVVFHRMGWRDRGSIRLLQWGVLAILGLFVARRCVDPSYPRDRACALVAIFSMIFLYHRVYDAVILVLPLAHALGMCRNAPTGARFRLAAICALVLVPMYAYPWWFSSFEAISAGWGEPGRFAGAIVLPISSWATIAAIFGLGISSGPVASSLVPDQYKSNICSPL